jgi:hypothetical protein
MIIVHVNSPRFIRSNIKKTFDSSILNQIRSQLLILFEQQLNINVRVDVQLERIRQTIEKYHGTL